jgi:hypothetical protein
VCEVLRKAGCDVPGNVSRRHEAGERGVPIDRRLVIVDRMKTGETLRR